MGEYDYKPNSNRYKEEQREKKRAEKVISGSAKTKKKGELSKIANNLLAEDIHNVMGYVHDDIIIPTIKDTLWSVLSNSIEMLIFGSTSARRGGKSGGYGLPARDYRDYSNRGGRPVDRRDERPRSDFADISFTRRGDAELVLSRMHAMMSDYGVVSVGDMYDLAGEVPPHTAYRWGWTSLRDAYVVHSRGEYVIKTPRPCEID